jgi:hypothetical protein
LLAAVPATGKVINVRPSAAAAAFAARARFRILMGIRLLVVFVL